MDEPPRLFFFGRKSNITRVAYLAPPILLLLLFLDCLSTVGVNLLVPFRRQIVSIRPC